MSKSNMCILRGIATALVSGIAVGFIAGQMMNHKKRTKKKADKAVHAVGDLLENVHCIFK